VIFSVLFALLGFSYNVWRMEVSEQNNNIRTACFEILLEPSSLEQLVFAAHYDGDPVAGNPRKGWSKAGLIGDLSALTAELVEQRAGQVKQTWSQHWEAMPRHKASFDRIVGAIDAMRARSSRCYARWTYHTRGSR
jgi:hypothetical protein